MTASWKNLRTVPDPPSFTNDAMAPPKARSFHFVGDSGRLIISFLDHGIVYGQGVIIYYGWLIPLKVL